MKLGLLLPADSTEFVKIVPVDTLGDCQAAVNGFIEAVAINPGLLPLLRHTTEGAREVTDLRRQRGECLCLYVNEDGLLRELPHNKRASFVAGKPIVGDVLLFAIDAAQMEPVTLEVHEIAAILQLLPQVLRRMTDR